MKIVAAVAYYNIIVDYNAFSPRLRRVVLGLFDYFLFIDYSSYFCLFANEYLGAVVLCACNSSFVVVFHLHWFTTKFVCIFLVSFLRRFSLTVKSTPEFLVYFFLQVHIQRGCWLRFAVFSMGLLLWYIYLIST